MNNRKLNLMAVILGICLAATIYAALVHASTAKQRPHPPPITTLPEISSCVQAVQVQRVFFRKRDPNSDSMELVLQLMNNSDASIVAISIEWTSKKERSKGSLTTESFGADTPKILVMPRSLYEVAIPVENFQPDARVQVGSVFFGNGTEDGCTESLKNIHELKSEVEKKFRKDP